MATGTGTLDFGAFPGASDASLAITGQAGIVAGSLAEAWLRPIATTDHSADEHMIETLAIFASNIVAGTGFTIYGFNTSQTNEPTAGPGAQNWTGGKGTRIYGKWTIAWTWA